MHYLRSIFSNPVTTVLGLGALFTALGHFLTALASGDTSHIIPDLTAIITAFGLLFAKDAKTS